jgi:hypothetical protein
MDYKDICNFINKLKSSSKLNSINSPKLIESIEHANIYKCYKIHEILKLANFNLDDIEKYILAFHGVNKQLPNHSKIIENIIDEGLKIGFNNNRKIKFGPDKGIIDKNIYSTSVFHNAAGYTYLDHDICETYKFGFVFIIAIPETEINKTVTHASGYYGISQFKYDKIEELHPKCVFKLPAGGLTNTHNGCPVFSCESTFMKTNTSKKFDRLEDQFITSHSKQFNVVGLAIISLAD